MSRRLLLDTHVLLWALSAPRHLPSAVAAKIKDPETDVYLSAVATWEIAIKSAFGKIKADLATIVTAARDAELDELPISIAHTQRLQALPPHHRDPFDRLLVAQALEEGLTIVTHDRALAAYGAPTLWA